MGDYYFKKLLDDRTAAIIGRLEVVEAKLDSIMAKEETMSEELDQLTVAVDKVKTVDDGAIALLNGISAFLTAHANDPAAIRGYATDLTAKSDELAAAVANVPAP